MLRGPNVLFREVFSIWNVFCHVSTGLLAMNQIVGYCRGYGVFVIRGERVVTRPHLLGVGTIVAVKCS